MFKPAVLFTVMLLALTACQSVYEKQGDKHLQEGDGLKALQRYMKVPKSAQGSKDFKAKLTQAYTLGLTQTADAQGDPDIILSYREKILPLLSSLSDEKLKSAYISAISHAAEKLVTLPDARFRFICKAFVKDTHNLGAPQQVLDKMARISEEVARREAAYEAKKKEVVIEL